MSSHAQVPPSDLIVSDSLIPVFEAVIGSRTVFACCAKELHVFLKVATRFNDWIATRISEYCFQENQDFLSFTEKPVKPRGGRPALVYHLTLDMAKELAMVERNEKGRQARRYFIECERRLLEQAQPQPAPALPAPEALPWSDWYARFDVDLGAVTGDGFEAGQALARCWLHELRREALAGVDSHNGRALLLMGLLKRLAEFPPEDIRNPHRAGGSAGAKTLNRLLAGFCWALDEYAKRCIVQEPEELDFDPVALAKRYFTLPRRRAVRSAAQEGGQRPFSQAQGRRSGGY